ncbi:MAG: hemolysin III family protein [Oscillospiraceae bacterium]|nr:hemolysin III family protein [Oscillospiraceae bacterium]
MSRYMAHAKDPWSSLTHMLGAVGFLFGTVALIVWGLVQHSGVGLIISAVVFGLSLVALYTASAVYHFVSAEPKLTMILRKLDHSMIYVLIAGSYTPVLICYYPPVQRVWMLTAIWAIALCGIAVKLLWFEAPRWLYTAFYLMMGWFVLVDLKPLNNLPVGALGLLVGGGVSYTIGGLIYGLKRPILTPRFGFHELFHVFVLMGSLLHYLMVLIYIV